MRLPLSSPTTAAMHTARQTSVGTPPRGDAASQRWAPFSGPVAWDPEAGHS